MSLGPYSITVAVPVFADASVVPAPIAGPARLVPAITVSVPRGEAGAVFATTVTSRREAWEPEWNVDTVEAPKHALADVRLTAAGADPGVAKTRLADFVLS